MKELDLDYLEDANYRRRKRVTTPLQELSPDSVDLVKVVLLGASGVGKTSIIQEIEKSKSEKRRISELKAREIEKNEKANPIIKEDNEIQWKERTANKKSQFVWNEFCEKYLSTEKKCTYYPSVIINDRLYELKISDIPVIPFFPVNAYYEWTDYRFYGLRSATAYVLVFDLANPDTFQYVRTLRDQMVESRDMTDVPVVVVGNKQDLVQDGGVNESKRQDISTIVTKHWKCTYIECSAKFNWKVMHLFKQLMEVIDSSYTMQPQRAELGELYADMSDMESQSKCSIL